VFPAGQVAPSIVWKDDSAQNQFFLRLASAHFWASESSTILIDREVGILGTEGFLGTCPVLNFLAGFLTLLPHLGLKRAVQLRHDGEKLFSDAHYSLMSFSEPPTVSKVRRLRVFEERVVGFIEKVERDLTRERAAKK
jgi:hypothetical protein